MREARGTTDSKYAEHLRPRVLSSLRGANPRNRAPLLGNLRSARNGPSTPRKVRDFIRRKSISSRSASPRRGEASRGSDWVRGKLEIIGSILD